MPSIARLLLATVLGFGLGLALALAVLVLGIGILVLVGALFLLYLSGGMGRVIVITLVCLPCFAGIVFSLARARRLREAERAKQLFEEAAEGMDRTTKGPVIIKRLSARQEE